MKRAVILVCFGSSDINGVNNSVGILKKEISEYFYNTVDVLVAFTSCKIIEKLRDEKKIYINNLEECLVELQNKCYEEVVIQPLYVMEGRDNVMINEEFDKFRSSFKRLVVNNNIFSGRKEDIVKNIQMIVSILGSYYKGKALLLAGHGSKNQSNNIYEIIEGIFNENCRARIYIATLEGEKNINDEIIKMKKNREKEVVIVPLFLISGKHFNKDVINGDGSWKFILENQGINVIGITKSLLEYKEIRKIYIKNIKFSENLQIL